MDIHYILNGSEKVLSVPVTQNAAHEEELMKSDFVRLSFDDAEGIELPLDAYIVPFTDGVRYSLLEPYKPEQRNEEQWHYEPLFQHPKMYLGKVPFVFKTKDSDNNDTTQLEWDYTGYVGMLLGRFCEQINAALGLSAAESFTYTIVGKIDDIVSTTFSSMDILSGLSNIAGKLRCEYHLDWELKILYFGHITLDRVGVDKPTLEVGVNVGSPSVRSSKDGFWNAFEPQGSTRNISRKAVTGENVQSTIRLSLRNYLVSGIEKYPDGIIYTDGKGNVITKSQFEQSGVSLHLKSLIFDEVYPKLDLYVYDVRSRERYLLDDNKKKVIDHYENGVPVYKRYSIWYMRLAYPTYNQLGEVTAWTDYTIDPTTQIIDGKSLYGAFQPNTKANAESSPLAGRGSGDDGGYGFALNYHTDKETIPADEDAGDSGVQIKAGDFEIVFQQDGDLIMPTTAAGGIIPKGKSTPSLLGNIVNLYNIVMDSSFTQSAQNELENVAKKEIANYAKDNNSYSVKAYPDAFEGKDENLQDKNPHLFIGQSVTYKNGDYTLETRVMKLVTNLDYDFVQEITVGNEVIKGTTTTLKEQVQSILSGSAGVGGGGVDENLVRRIIKAFGDTRYLSKLNDDTAQGLITLIKGLQVGNQFVSGLLGEGGVFRKDADGKTYLEADKMYIRMRAYFDTVEVREYKHSAGNRVASPAGAKCVRVAWFNSSNEELEQTQENLSSVAYFRCYFRASDNEDTVRNNFVVGDQVYCHITTVNGADDNPSTKGLNQKHYWRLCIGKNTDNNLTEDGEGWVDLSNRSTESIGVNNYTGYQTNSDVPEPQDSMVQLGNVNDTTRQGAIIEFVTGANAPAYQIYQGINSFSLTGRNMITLGYNSATGKAELKVYGDAFIGDPNRTTYIEYVQDDGTEAHMPKLKIKAEVEFTNSKQDLDNFVQSHQNNYDDTEVRGLIDGLQDQIDGQVESWFYNYAPVHVDEHGAPDSRVPLNIAPYSDWTTEADKIAHLGDTFTDNSTGYCWRFSRNEDTNAFEWVVIEDSALISALQKASKAQETADNKRRVFLVQPTPPYDAGDLWVNATYPANYTGATDEANHKYNNDILKCVIAKASGSAFSIDDWKLSSKYTDDTKFNGYISALLNDTGLSGDAAAAAAQRAVLSALGVGTVVSGGLLLTSLIGMRQYKNNGGDKSDINNYTTWAGISGEYNANVKGGGIAAWYGGGMVDHEVNTTATDYAKSLFRFDGSGYLAGGNITWNSQGAITIKNITTLSDSNNKNLLNELATFNSAFTFGTDGSDSTTALYIRPNVPFEKLFIGTSDANKKEVATQEWANGQFVTKTFFDSIFRLYNGTTKINVNDTIPSSNDLNIEAMFGFWTKKYISALGQGDDGSTSYSTLAALNDVNISSPAVDQVLAYNGTHWYNKTINLGSLTLAGLSDVTISSPAANQMLGYDATAQKWVNVAVPAKYTLPTATDSVLGGVKVGTTLAIANGVLNLKSGIATAGTYRSVTVDTYGRVTAGTNPTTIAGYGITDAKIANGVITLGANSITPLTSHQSLAAYTKTADYKTLTFKVGTDSIGSYSPTSALELLFAAGNNIALSVDSSTHKLTIANTYSYTHPTGGANTTIAAANGKVLSAITVNNLGHVTSVSAKTLAAADIPDLSGTYATTARVSTLEGYFNNGAAKKADKLATARSLWGNNFDGSTDINGNIVMNSANGTYIQIGAIRIVYDSANNALKVVKSDGTTAANFYATGGISALGMSEDGSAGTGDVTWALLASSNDTRQIALSHLTTALSTYATQSWVTSNFNKYTLPTATTSALGGIKVGYTTSGKNYKVQVDASGNAFVNVPWQAGTGTVTSVKVGTTSYTPTNGVVSLPAYPTSLPASDVYAWAKASTKPSYTLDEVSDGSTRKLANYLPLSGGTIVSDGFAPLFIQRNHTTNAAAIGFKHYSSGTTVEVMGYIAMNAKDGALMRMDSSTAGIYNILDTSNSSVSKSGETLTVKINGTTQSLTNTNTTYSAGSGLSLSGTTFSIASNVLVQGSVIDTHGEGNATIRLDGGNDLYAFYDRGGTCDAYEVEQSSTLTAQTLTRTSTSVSSIEARVFNGVVGYSYKVYSGEKFAVYDLALPAVYPYATHFFWSFGNGSWKPAKMRILIGKYSASGFTYISKYSSDACPAYGKVNIDNGATGIDRLRIVVSKYLRLACFGITNYESNGLSTTYMNRCLDDAVYRNISPAKDNTWSLGTSSQRWKEVRAVNLYGALTGNASTATKLQTARTLWGQSFDGSANINGFLTGWNGCAMDVTDTWSDGTNSHPWYGIDHRYPNTGVYSTTISDYYGLTLKTSSVNISMTDGGNVGIGIYSPTYKLHVYGTLGVHSAAAMASTLSVTDLVSANGGIAVPSSKYVKIGNAYLTYDSDTQALRVSANADGTGAMNFYARGGVSALGQGSDSGGGGQGDVTWELLAKQATNNRTIHSSYISGTLANYLPLSGGTMSNTNKVTNLNADYLDGYHESSFLRHRVTTNVNGEATLWSQLGLKQYIAALPDSLSGTYNYGQVVSFATENARFEIYASHHSSNPSYATNGLYYRTGWGNDKREWTRFLDSNNSSVTKSGETISIKINNVTQSLTNTTYSANNGVGLSGTTFYNSGVRAVSISGNSLRVNTNGTNSDLTIPYATNASVATRSKFVFHSGISGAAYVSGDTHIMYLGYLEVSNYGNTTLMISSGFWGNQHNSVDLITIANDFNTNGDKLTQATVQRVMVGGSYERKFYCKKETNGNTLRVHLTVLVEGGNGYGNWYISIPNSNDGALWHTDGTKNYNNTGFSEIPFSGKVSYALNAGSSTKATQDSDGNAINTTYLKKSGGTISNTNYAPLIIERSGSVNAAAIGFKNSNGILGYIGFTGGANGSLIRLDSSTVIYTILDSQNSSVSKSGETLSVKINGSTQSLTNTWRGITDTYAPTTSDSTISLSQTGALNMYNKLTKTNGRWTWGGNGQTAYCLIATINTNSAYINNPITFEINGRNLSMTHITVWYKNQSAVDPDIDKFTTDQATSFYLYKVSENTWNLYGISPDGTWGNLSLYNIKSERHGLVTVKMESVASLPEGYITPTYTGNVAYATNAGNAATATALQTARTLWGQSFNGTANVSGDMTSVGTITFSSLGGANEKNLLYQLIGDNDYFRLRTGATATNGGWVEIATADDGNEPIYVRQYTGVFSNVARTLTLLDGSGNTSIPKSLSVGNNITAGSADGTYIQIGGARIVWDNTNKALKVIQSDNSTAANFYATGGVSSLGMGKDGSAGVGDVTWALLANNSDTRQIAISHLSGTGGVLSTLTGYTTSGKNYAVQKDSNNHLFVNVPWDNTNTTYSAGAGISLSGTTFSNSGVRSTTINGNYLRVNTNGTNADLTIPYATNADMVDNVHLDSILTSKNSIGNRTQNNHDFHSALNNGVYEVSWGGYIANHPSDWEDGSNHFGQMLHFGTDSNHGYILLDQVARSMYFKYANSGSGYGAWYKVAHSGNSSVSKNGETLSVTINGTTQSLTNTNTTYSAGNGLALNGTQFSITSNVLVQGSVIDTHVEGNGSFVLGGGNELYAFYDRGGTCDAYEVEQSATLTSQTLTRTSTSVGKLNAEVFDGLIGYNQSSVYQGEKFAVYDLALPMNYPYGAFFYWSFGNGGWAAKKMRILIGKYNADGFTYIQKYTTDTCPGFGHVYIGNSATGFDRLRIVVSSYTRLACFGVRFYASTGLRTTYVNRCISTDHLYRSVHPAKDNTWSLGASNLRWAEVRAVNFYGTFNGTATKATQDSDGNTINSTYLKLSGGTLSGKLNIGSVTTSHATKLEVRTANTTADSVEWGVAIKNPYNNETNYKLGAGIRIGLGSDTETTKFGGIAYVGTATYFNSGKLVFYASGAERAYLTSDNLYIGGNAVCHAGNSSVSKSGETLTVKINGTSQSLTNTWRGIQNNLTSDSTTDSLSAAQGKALANGSARDNTKLPLAGGTMTGNIKIGNSTFYASGSNGGINSLALSDDSILGDCNIGGHLGLKSLNGTEAGISFYNSSGGQVGKLTANGGDFYLYSSGSTLAHLNIASLYASGSVQIGSIKLVYDSNNNAIKVIKSDGTNANFYATGGISALGAGSDSGGGGNYLPLSGGTLSGTLRVATGYGISDATDNGLLVYHPVSWTGVTSSQWGVGAAESEGVIRSSNASLKHYRYGVGLCDIIDSMGGTINGQLSVSYNNYPNIHLSCPSEGEVSIYYKNSSSYGWAAGQRTWGSTVGNGFGIGEYNNGLGVCFYINTNGTCVATRGFNNQSDARFKTILKDVDLSVEQIAKMPAILYRWNDREDARIYAGSIAQNWESVLPQVTDIGTDPRHFRSLDYGVAALISAITVARKVMTHEEKIALLETRVSALEKENGEQATLIESLQNELDNYKN